MPFAELLLTVAWTVGPNGHLIHQSLEPPVVRETLPVAELQSVSSSLWVVFHQVPAWSRAFYGSPDGDAPELTAFERQLALQAPMERVLPGLEVPRLFLYAPYYRDGDGMRPIHEMAIDVTEGYFHALLEAWLDVAMQEGGALDATFVERRATEVMADVPEPNREEAYLSALADFGAHVLATANELHRISHRQRAAGKDPCRLVDVPATLFGLWSRIFSEGAGYPGHFFLPGDAGSPGRWVTSRGTLGVTDKTMLMEAVFGAAYSGDVRRDFPSLCPAD